MRILPLQDCVLLEVRGREAKTPGGLFIPENARQRPNRAVVLAVGPGKWINGVRQTPQVEVGDTVLFDAYAIELVLADGAMANAQGSPYAAIGERCIVREETIHGVEE